MTGKRGVLAPAVPCARKVGPSSCTGRTCGSAWGQVSDAYLVRNDVGQRGYSVVIWRGRHVAEPTELTETEAAHYYREVLDVSRAIEAHYRPAKMNLMILGNLVPHLHTHVIPRYVTDDSPGRPPRFMRVFPSDREPPIQEDEYEADVAVLRRMLGTGG